MERRVLIGVPTPLSPTKRPESTPTLGPADEAERDARGDMPQGEPATSPPTKLAQESSGERFVEMAQLVAVSSAELVAVLEAAGFERLPSDSRSIRMERALVRVTFDATDKVSPEALVEVMRAARLSVGRLIESLDEIARAASGE